MALQRHRTITPGLADDEKTVDPSYFIVTDKDTSNLANSNTEYANCGDNEFVPVGPSRPVRWLFTWTRIGRRKVHNGEDEILVAIRRLPGSTGSFGAGPDVHAGPCQERL
jgi:hypothetical protein